MHTLTVLPSSLALISLTLKNIATGGQAGLMRWKARSTLSTLMGDNMFIVENNFGFELPISVSMDDTTAAQLYVLLGSVAQSTVFSNESRILATHLSDDINKIFMLKKVQNA